MQALIWTFFFDLTLFILMIAVFFCIRNKRGDVLFNYKHHSQDRIAQHFESIDLKPSVHSDSVFKQSQDEQVPLFSMTSDGTLQVPGKDQPPELIV